jgi:proline dehydrogenase
MLLRLACASRAGVRWQSSVSSGGSVPPLMVANDAPEKHISGEERQIKRRQDERLKHGAFQTVSTKRLWRAFLVFKMCSYPWLVKNSELLMSLGSLVATKRGVESIVRNSFFKHFCAGETHEAALKTVSELRKLNVGSILDYAVEEDVPTGGARRDEARVGVVSARTYDYLGEAKCDINMELVLESIGTAAAQKNRQKRPPTTSGRVDDGQTADNEDDGDEENGFVAIKLTALCKPELLQRISEILSAIRHVWQNYAAGDEPTISFDQFRRAIVEGLGLALSDGELRTLFDQFDVDGNGTIEYVEWTGTLSLQNMISRKLFFASDEHRALLTAAGRLPLISEEDTRLVDNLRERLNHIAAAARAGHVRVLIDAEQSYLQPAIGHFARNLQREHNADEPTIFNTYQCYLRRAGHHVRADLRRAEREHFYFAGKFVRGAYMVQERKRATTFGVDSPIFDCIEHTHQSYDACVQEALQSSVRASIMIASHNPISIERATSLMRERNISPPSGGVYFAQLFGMSDPLTFDLGQRGYQVYKYLPYGPVAEVMPYLIRRAQENSDMLSYAVTERELVWAELKHRLFGLRPPHHI